MNSPSIEDYIKAIYKAEELGEVTSQDIAHRIGVSPPAVSKMLRKLLALKLVRISPRSGVHLTPSGKKTALTTIRRHRLIELYLVRELGYTWDEVHDEAERLEHHISPLFERRIADRLGNPEFDPHGDPIPSSEGVMPSIEEGAISEFDTQISLTITRLRDNPELLRYAANLDLMPGTKLELLGREPFGGPFVVLRAGERLLIAPEAAAQIFVAKAQ
jgi:DtxR family Mn-dependent transcriptional regulator